MLSVDQSAVPVQGESAHCAGRHAVSSPAAAARALRELVRRRRFAYVRAWKHLNCGKTPGLSVCPRGVSAGGTCCKACRSVFLCAKYCSRQPTVLLCRACNQGVWGPRCTLRQMCLVPPAARAILARAASTTSIRRSFSTQPPSNLMLSQMRCYPTSASCRRSRWG